MCKIRNSDVRGSIARQLHELQVRDKTFFTKFGRCISRFNRNEKIVRKGLCEFPRRVAKLEMFHTVPRNKKTGQPYTDGRARQPPPPGSLVMSMEYNSRHRRQAEVRFSRSISSTAKIAANLIQFLQPTVLLRATWSTLMECARRLRLYPLPN